MLDAWVGERYFGPLMPGSERTLGSWLSLLLKNAIPGRHWSRFQPALALRGAPLVVRLTDRGRLVVTIARGWSRSLRPRVSYWGPAQKGFELLLASGPEPRARIRTAAEAFPGRSPGHFNRPDRQWRSAGEPTELMVIEPEGRPPLVVWCEPEALPLLREWSTSDASIR